MAHNTTNRSRSFIDKQIIMTYIFRSRSSSYHRKQGIRCGGKAMNEALPYSCSQWSSMTTHSFAQFSSSRMKGSNAFPFSVKEYSILTGVSGYTFRLTIPSCSNSFSLSDNSRPLIGIEDSMVQKRCGPESSWCMIKPVQRLLKMFIAFSNLGHKVDWLNMITSGTHYNLNSYACNLS